MLGIDFGVATQFRPLGTFEEYAWLLQKTKPLTIVVVAELDGATTVEGWRSALDDVQVHHPILSACIRKRPGFRPHFEAAPGVKLSLQVLPYDSPESVLDRCISEMEIPFAEGDVLLRATVFHSEQRSTLLVAADHAAMDGRSVVYVIRDLVRSLAGIVLGPQKPLMPSQDELLGLPQSDTYAVPLTPNHHSSDSIEHPANQIATRFHYERFWLGPSTVAALTERVRQEQTTVHGALVAGILLAGRARSQRWAQTAIHCLSPIDNRDMMGLEDELGAPLTLATTELQSVAQPDFWSLARQVRGDVLALGNTEAAARNLAPLRTLLDTEMSAIQMADLSRQFAHALMVTNYGRLKLPSRYGSLRLLSVSPMVYSGGPHTQTVSVATLDGHLCMTNVSAEPIPDLLAGAGGLLVAQLS